MTETNKEIDAVILCGGLGTRFRAVASDFPKGLAPISGRPFLDILIDELIRQGFQRAIFCVGHMRELIIQRYKGWQGIEIDFSEETEPLGTGGAIKNALALISTELFVVMNGDSFCDVNFGALLQSHNVHNASATMVLCPGDSERKDAGVVSIGAGGRVESFDEKPEYAKSAFINAGIYVFNKIEWANVEANQFSIERDYLPPLISKKSVLGYPVIGQVYDIGTPDRYHRYSKLLPLLRR